jgi:CHAD domain-containing protein
MDVREIEWQFDALDLRPVARWLEQAPDGARVQVDTADGRPAGIQLDLYLDTEDRRFHRAGYALRIRRAGRRAGAESTLKSLDPPAGDGSGPRSRREVSERLDEADPEALLRAPGPVGERVRAVAGRKRLLPLFEVRTRRRVFPLQVDGSASGEIALDETAIRAASGERPIRLQRVEIEVPEPAVEAVEPLVGALREACALQPAALSKYEAGLLSADVRPAPQESFGATELEANATIRDLALAVLRRQFSTLLAREPGTRLGDDIEELHDMRVASRRLRAAMSLFRDLLPETVVRQLPDLAWLGRALGAVRDLDVQLEQLDEWLDEVAEPDRDALEALRSLLEEQRRTAREAMLEALDSPRYEAFVRAFGRTLRAGHHARSGPAALPALAVAPDLIEKRFRQFRKAGDGIDPESPPTDYHALRIRAKRLRYTLEFTTALYPGHTERLTKRLVALQDLLGLHQDADVAIERLRRLTAEHGRELRPATIFAMGEIAERYRRSMVELRAAFPRTYGRIRHGTWKPFHKTIEAEREQAAPPPAAEPDEAASTEE